jgi:MinD-like ATPase involved in chromosome partitioning or flagellar assembly
MLGDRVAVVVAASGATWEVEALRVLGAPQSRAVVLKRCVDLADLLATAATGQARVAVVASGLPGLDADSLSALSRSGVAVVLVVEPGLPGPGAQQLPGVHETVPASDVTALSSVVPAAASAADHGPAPTAAAEPVGHTVSSSQEEPPSDVGRVVAVWGPTGAPGRTTVAVNLAAELASRGHETLLVDADGYGGAVAQHLGVLDEVSGLLSAARLGNTGRLDLPRLAAVARSVAPALRVLTGLPRADRWHEVRPAPFDLLLETARSLSSYVVLDLGFGLEEETSAFGSGAPQRNHMTLAGLDHADELVVVGAADPVGLARLARGLVELREVVPAAAVRVVVNRVRPSLGWADHDVRAMVEGFVMPASMHFLPDDTPAVDRALVAGRPLLEAGESPLPRALAGLVDALDGASAARRRRSARLRPRRAGRAR